MELNLFDFDFSESNEEMFSDEKVMEKFNQLQEIFKERRNGHFVTVKSLPRDLFVYLEEFKKRGWIERHENAVIGPGIDIPDQYLIYSTADELVDEYREKMNKALSDPDVSWHYTILPIINSAARPVRWKNEKVKAEVSRRKREINKKAATELGLKHFIEVPSSRGIKMNPFGSKWSRKHVLPKVAEYVIPITDFEEMYNFFHEHAFFFGRRDWDWNDSTTPAYPEFKKLLPSLFDIACLCEAGDEKTIKLILDYAGCTYGGFKYKNPDITYVYPDGWSMERYAETLTAEDKKVIEEDQERLKRLHSY